MTDPAIIARQRTVYTLQSIIVRVVVDYARLQGITNVELSKRANLKGSKISPRTISGLYTGRHERQMPVYTLSVLCECVGVSLLDIITVKPLDEVK